VTLQIKGGELGTFQGASKNYSGNHMALFECKLTAPPHLALVDHSYKEYLMKHRINFSNWKLADLDNYMNGNPYFSHFLSEKDYKAKVDKRMNVIETKEIGSWNDYLKVKDRHDEIFKLRELLEPKSNWDAPINELKEAQVKA
jgi:hypothetical protein